MTTPPRPPADRAEFLAALGAAGLLTPPQFAKATAVLPPAAATAAQTAQGLVAAGMLTRFQAERLLAGRTEGFVVGSYVIQEQIGRGSAGRVYRATHRAMNRSVALKVLNPDLTRADAARQAFQREVRAAARLNHPNIVTAYDANEVGDRSYLVLEYVDGPTVAALVRDRGPLPVGEACELVRQTAVGLQHAHEQGLVHRDIKPGNLLIGRASKSMPGCVVKITDFGLTSLVRPAPVSGACRHAGQGVSADYAAPEQVKNPHQSDHRSDLYSLGCVFYFLLTGRPPFPDAAADPKARRHQLEEPIPVERVRADVPAVVAEIVARLLAKDPNSRFQSAAGLAARLDGLAARAITRDDDGLVNFDMPAVQAGQYSFASGYLAGMSSTLPHHQSAGYSTLPLSGGRDTPEPSPWAQIADDLTITPLAPTRPDPHSRTSAVPPAGRDVVTQRASRPRPDAPSLSTFLALCCAVVLVGITVIGVGLRVVAK